MVETSSTPTPQIDHARRAATISLVASLFLLALKATGAGISGSSAVLSDALESIVNIVTAIVALAVVRFASQPADREHPYGHGKAELISATFEGGLICFAAIAIALESLRAFYEGPHLQELGKGLWFISVAAALNFILSVYLKTVGHKTNSETLLASAEHVMADVKTTVGVVLGLVVVKVTGFAILDPIIAMLVAGHLAWTGFIIVRKSFGGLLDELDESTLNRLSQSIRSHRQEGIIDIHQLKVIRSGSFHHIDAHLVVPEFWDISHAHQVAHDFEAKIIKDYPYDGEIAFHLDPCNRRYCQICDFENCQIRKSPFEFENTFDAKAISGSAPYLEV